MKIAHICISDPYVDNWGYQSNLLPHYLQLEGVENYVITSANNLPHYLKREEANAIMAKGANYDIDGVHIRRIRTSELTSSLLVCYGLNKALERIGPDAIFHHNFNCTSFPIAAKYAREHGVALMVDNHADEINMTQHKLWVWLYYKFLIRLSCRFHQKQIYKAYGVTHARCDFIRDYYGVKKEKIDFLPIGADVDMSDKIKPKGDVRKQYDFKNDEFIVVSGGKMGTYKGTDHLIRAVEELKVQHPHLRLVLFGSFEDETSKRMAEDSGAVNYFGWCNRIKTLELLKMADVACWPIHHTTLIEDAVSVCTPVINRKTGTSEHLIDGNGVWLESGSVEEVKEALLQMINQTSQQKKEMQDACLKMRDAISYHTVAKKVVNDIILFK